MIPEVQWTDLIPGDLHVEVRDLETGEDGNLYAHELEIISKLVKLTNPEVLFEIGTFNGRTTLNLAAHSEPTARVYTLDLPRERLDKAALALDVCDRKYIDKPASGLHFHGTDVEQKVVQFLGDSATFDFTPYRASVDFVFVDGAHSYPYVLSDSRRALQMIRRPGVILWHDYETSGHIHWPGLVKALNELHAGEPAFRHMKHITGTALVILQVDFSWPTRWIRSVAPRLFGTKLIVPPARDSIRR
jgi:predicted O-methyltransferase YrrM